MDLKMKETEFMDDIEGLLRPGLEFNPDDAYELVKSEIIEKL